MEFTAFSQVLAFTLQMYPVGQQCCRSSQHTAWEWGMVSHCCAILTQEHSSFRPGRWVETHMG